MRPIFRCLLLLSLVGGNPAFLQAQGDADLRQALALQKTMQRIIQQNEATIACILVSRSDYYPRDPHYPGKLGIYDAHKLNLPSEMSEPDRDRWVKKLNLAEPNTVPPAFGSGVVIDAEGLILTNYHVVQDAAKVYVRLPGGKGSYADIHAADPRSDLAVLKLIQPVGPLKAIALGDADKLERGQFVLTLSNPYAAGFRDGQPSASWGILSNIRRRAVLDVNEEEFTKPFHFYGILLQTDARMNLGCSGGALLNLQGQMVGLMTSMAAIQGGETAGGFAVPINARIRQIIDVLKTGDEIDYGFLGIGMDKTPVNGQMGVRVTTFGAGSPAAAAEIREGDVLLSVNGQPIRHREDIFLTIGMQLAGAKVRILVRTGNQEHTADVTLAKLHVPGKAIMSAPRLRPYFRGVRVDYTSLLMQQEPRWRFIPTGVLVSEVQANSAADRAKLRAGDVITLVNGQRVTSPAAFYQAVNDARAPVELTLYAHSNDIPRRVSLK